MEKQASVPTNTQNMRRKFFGFIPSIAFATGRRSLVQGGIIRPKPWSSAVTPTRLMIHGVSVAGCMGISQKTAKWKLP